MSRRLAALALFAALLPQLALAEQARVARFEGVARAGPSADAAPLQTFPEGAQVSVSEESQGGWRRVRLADGKVGWIEERALTFGPVVVDAPVPPAPATAPAVPAAPRAPPAAVDLRPRIYVKDLGHLSELVKDDPVAGPKAATLARRRAGAWTVGGIGLAVSTGFFVYGVSQMNQHTDVNDPKFGDTGNSRQAVAIGVGTLLVAGVVAVAIAPKGGDLLDVINAWNVRHPDQQFTIREHALEH